MSQKKNVSYRTLNVRVLLVLLDVWFLWGAWRFIVVAVADRDNQILTVAAWLTTILVWLAVLYLAIARPEIEAVVESDQHKRKLIGFGVVTITLVVIYPIVFNLIPGSPRNPITWNQIFGVGFGLMLMTMFQATLDAWQAASRRPEFWLSVLSSIIALVMAEVAIRYYVYNILDDSTLRSFYTPENENEGLILRFLPHHYMLYVNNVEWIGKTREDITNSDSFRGPEIETSKPGGTFRIVAIGGSTTYGTEVPTWDQAYPAQLENVLRDTYGYSQVEVLNAGVGGYNSWESLVNLQFKVLDFDPDLVIVYQNVNDIDARLVRPDVYRGDNSGLRHVWDFESVEDIEEWPSEIPSVLWRFLGVNFRWFEVQEALSQTRAFGYSCTGVIAESSCLGVDIDQVLTLNPPTYYERNLRYMASLAQTDGADVLFVTFAYISWPDTYTERPVYQAGIAEHNEVMKAVADEMNAYLYDLAEMMPLEEKYFADGRHMTEEGNRLRAELIGAYLYEMEIIDN